MAYATWVLTKTVDINHLKKNLDTRQLSKKTSTQDRGKKQLVKTWKQKTWQFSDISDVSRRTLVLATILQYNLRFFPWLHKYIMLGILPQSSWLFPWLMEPSLFINVIFVCCYSFLLPVKITSTKILHLQDHCIIFLKKLIFSAYTTYHTHVPYGYIKPYVPFSLLQKSSSDYIN